MREIKTKKDYYLGDLEINKNQEKALKKLCYALTDLQEWDTKYSFIEEGRTEITNPFTDSTGRFEVNPIEEYGEYFTSSCFIDLAKDFNLTNESKEWEILDIVRNKVMELVNERLIEVFDNVISSDEKFKSLELAKEIVIKKP